MSAAVRVLLISYDLRGEDAGRDPSALLEVIRRHQSCQVMQSLWLMHTDRAATDILHELWAKMNPNDRLLVTEITGDVMAWLGLDRDTASWILLNNPAT
jgi:hypothetical protein